jgi:amidase
VSATLAPAISVPAGFTDDGLPVGIQIVGRRGDDLGVLQLAHAFEQATHFGRRTPTSFVTADATAAKDDRDRGAR